MEGATLFNLEELKGLEGRKLIIIDKDHNFEFTKCAAPDDCITYTKKGSELDELEMHMIKAQLLKDQQNG